MGTSPAEELQELARMSVRLHRYYENALLLLSRLSASVLELFFPVDLQTPTIVVLDIRRSLCGFYRG